MPQTSDRVFFLLIALLASAAGGWFLTIQRPLSAFACAVICLIYGRAALKGL